MAGRSGNIQPGIDRSEHVGPDDTGDNIEAKRVVSYIWDPITSTWSRNQGKGQTLATRTDSTTTNITYVGKAAVGSSTANAVWQIFKMDETTTNTLIITYADGNSNFDNVWDNRAGLTYS